MLSLPNELLHNILRFCDFETIREVTCTNKRLHNLIEKNSHRLARRHVKSLHIEQEMHGDYILVAVTMFEIGNESERFYEFMIRKDVEENEGISLPMADAVRDVVDGLNNQTRWHRHEHPIDKNRCRRLKVSEPTAAAMLILEHILKRTSIHHLTLNCGSSEFRTTCLTMLETQRMRVYSMYMNIVKAPLENLATLPALLDFLGVKRFDLFESFGFSADQRHCFINALSESKLTTCSLYGTKTPPQCIVNRVLFDTIDSLAEIIKEWARGEREIVHYEFRVCRISHEETLAGIANCIGNVSGLRVILDGDEGRFLKIEKTALPEGQEHQKYLRIYTRTCKNVNVNVKDVLVISAPSQSAVLRQPMAELGPTSQSLKLSKLIRPCVECSTSAELRQTADCTAAFHNAYYET